MPSGSDAMEAGGKASENPFKGILTSFPKSGGSEFGKALGIHYGHSSGGATLEFMLVMIKLSISPEEEAKKWALLEEGNGVVSSCLNCFLSGGILYHFEYEVGPALFLAKARGGTCTLAVSDPDNIVRSPSHLFTYNGFGCYNVFTKNCEDFAIYCKTGLLVVEQGILGQSGQVVSIVGGPLAAVLSTPLRLVTANVYGMVAMGVGVYCASRYAADIGKRNDVIKVEAEDLVTRLATGRLQVAETMAIVPAVQ
ncbi:hypothetical protein IFM89_023957, partial [Coptis chinensis]